METISYVLLFAILVILGIIGLQGYRMKILFKMGLRNVSRRKMNTLIVVLGLMIGTTVISGSLVIGDTLENMYTKSVYDNYDETDELIFTFDTSGNFAFFNYTEYEELNAYIKDNDALQGKVSDISPELNFRVSVKDLDTKLSESIATIVAFDYSESTEFGKLYPLDGSEVTGEELPPGEVYVNQRLADELDIEDDHNLEIVFGENRSMVFTVRHVVEDKGRAAYVHPRSTGRNIFMTLATAQAVSDLDGKINIMKVSNAGDERSGLEHSDAVEESLTPYLRSRTPLLLLSKVKQDNIETAEENSEGLQDMFIVLGSFSIIAGMMLIVNIFVMLAEERKGEMGIARAVGLKRKQLMWMFLFEGTAYSVLAALVGTGAGMVVAYLVIAAFDSIVGGGIRFGETSGSLEFFTFTMDSLVTAFSVGLLITLLTIALASRKVSRLNIIRAIRNIPEPRYLRHEITRTNDSGSLLPHLTTRIHDVLMREYEIIIMGVGAFLVFCALVDIGILYKAMWAGYGGLSVLIYGTGLLLRRYISDERAFTMSGGLVLILWCYPYDLYDQLLGITLEGGMEMFISAGLFMVSSALLVVMYNSNLILGGLMKVFGRFQSVAPVFKTAISYPMDNRFRTGMTLAMFALIIFTVTMLAMVMGLFAGNIEQLTRESSGGYDMIAYTDPETPIDDIQFRIENSGNLSGDEFSKVVPLDTAYTLMYPVSRDDGPPGQRANEYLGMNLSDFQDLEDTTWYDLLGCSDSFFQESDFELQGWDTDEYDDYRDVWKAIREDPSLVILDEARMAEPGEKEEHGPMGGNKDIFRVTAGDYLVIRDLNGNGKAVQVVGFTKSRMLTGAFIRSDVVTSTGKDGFGSDATSITLFRFSEDVSESRQKEISKDVEREFLANGMKTFIIKEEIEDTLETMNSFMSLMQAFLGLGLFVGIAGLGIITIRSVAERRQQIGVLRAIGFKRGMILKSFLIESSYIALLGILIGVGLGIILGLRFYLNDSIGPEFTGDFVIPWSTLILVSLISYCLTFLSTIGPARRAARVAPAEALRYIG